MPPVRDLDPFNSTAKVPLPTINRYLRALEQLRIVDPFFYGEIMAQLCDPLGVVAEAVEAAATHPINDLTPGELAWRRLADR